MSFVYWLTDKNSSIHQETFEDLKSVNCSNKTMEKFSLHFKTRNIFSFRNHQKFAETKLQKLFFLYSSNNSSERARRTKYKKKKYWKPSISQKSCSFNFVLIGKFYLSSFVSQAFSFSIFHQSHQYETWHQKLYRQN